MPDEETPGAPTPLPPDLLGHQPADPNLQVLHAITVEAVREIAAARKTEAETTVAVAKLEQDAAKEISKVEDRHLARREGTLRAIGGAIVVGLFAFLGLALWLKQIDKAIEALPIVGILIAFAYTLARQQWKAGSSPPPEDD